MARSCPSLVNYSDKYLFITGGRNSKFPYENYNSVDYYKISNNTWTKAPDLKIARESHSSCTLSDKIYVFCGIVSGDCIDSIESLTITGSEIKTEWQLIEPTVLNYGYLRARSKALTVQLN